MIETTRNVAIFIFDDVEVLDFCGPFEVFSVTGKRDDLTPFNVYLVAEEKRPIIGRNNFSVNPHFTFSDCPAPDILLIPGGFGTRREMNNLSAIEWIKSLAPQAELILSVCTGTLLLAKAGLLENLKATTHFRSLDLLAQIAPQTTVLGNQRFVDNGRIITSAGISAGIDMSLHVVARLLGQDHAEETAKQMEYDWRFAVS
ncbi:MAG TPA: DJ-1/PfpI family protein [Blastocatellia bacterium]|nr:DJ-1/PfpI family protein [Blastocatellia bacterium]